MSNGGGVMRVQEELERKFLVRRVPQYMREFYVDTKLITQNYIYVDLEAEIRIREEILLSSGDTRYYEIKKIGNGAKRKEFITEITREIAEPFLLNSYYAISKQRDVYFYDGKFITVDFYDEELIPEGLIVAEIEFPTEGEMVLFRPYNWFIKEVTDDERFRDKNIWRAINKVEI